jgi:O-6-methylguanine DNA methyltransferase
MSKPHNPKLYWTYLSLTAGDIHLAASDKGLVYVGSLNRPFSETGDWIASRFPKSELARNDEKLAPYSAAIMEYFQGKRDFSGVPLDLPGTPFQQEVWQGLCDIPYGETRSYSEFAVQIGKEAAVRAVAAAIGANPALIFVPCHRVIGKNGKLTGYRGGLPMKEDLLRLEQTRSLPS